MPHETEDQHAHHETALRVTGGVSAVPSVNPQARKVARKKRLSARAYFDGLRSGDRVVLGQAITLLESTRPEDRHIARAIIDHCLPHAGNAIRVGITGVPGVGKSTFIESLGTYLTGKDRRLAVLTIDPSSTRTKGSILGDKTRMPLLASDPLAFIRPSPTAGSLGGVARTTRETILLCEAAGFDTIFVETVGVGQSEVEIHNIVDFFLLLMLAGAGDELQGIKRGIVEMADAIVITKADGTNVEKAREARSAYRNALTLFPPKPSAWHPDVMTCSAYTGDGIREVWDMIEAYRKHTQANGFFEYQRKQQARSWMHQAIELQLRDQFFSHPGVQEAIKGMEQKVMEGTLSSFSAAHRLLEIYRSSEG